jgi:hypothetical protein
MEDRRSGLERRDGVGRRQTERRRKVDCPFCAHYDSLVVDGWTDDGCYVRRRECQNSECRMMFHTEEKLRETRCGAPKL